MSLVDVAVKPDGIIQALNALLNPLTSIANALERLAPQIQEPTNAPYQAGLSDLRRTDPQTLKNIQDGLEAFAVEQGVALKSDSFIAAMREFERQVKESYGEEALHELPWNKEAGGLLFQGDVDHQRGKAASQEKSRNAAGHA